MARGSGRIKRPKRRKSKRERAVDRISSLGDSILLHILGFLETLDAVRTSLLSKRWRDLWNSVPNLSFKDGAFKIGASGGTVRCFSDFLTHVLIRRDDSKLFKVRLALESESCIGPLLVESLIQYAVKHGVQEMELEFANPCGVRPIVFPHCFFNCQSLRKLQLGGLHPEGVILPCPSGSNLTSLKSLQLDDLRLPLVNLDEKLFSSCPQLETLILGRIWHTDAGTFDIRIPSLITLEFLHFTLSDVDPQDYCKVVIVAPRLTTFKFLGYFPMPCSVDAPFLEDVFIDLDLDRYIQALEESGESSGYLEAFSRLSIEMVNEFRFAKSLAIAMETIEILSTFPSLLKGRLSKFDNLKCLRLEIDNIFQGFEVPPGILNYFLNSSTDFNITQNKRRIELLL